MRMTVATLVLLGLLGTTSSTHASTVCVQLDVAADRLQADEQTSAQQMFENALRAAGFEVTGTCDETWRLSHVKLGGGVQVLLVTPIGALTATTQLDQLATAYEGLVWRGLALRMHPATRAVEPQIAVARCARRAAA